MRKIIKYALCSFVLSIGMLSNEINAQGVKLIHFDDLQEIIDSDDSNVKVINFWATWCKPCVLEVPFFETISKKYSQKDVSVYLISMDFASEKERVNKFVERKKLVSEVVILNEPDYDSWINKIDPSWSGSLPATLLVNAVTGKKEFYEKSFELAELQQKIERLLNN